MGEHGLSTHPTTSQQNGHTALHDTSASPSSTRSPNTNLTPLPDSRSRQETASELSDRCTSPAISTDSGSLSNPSQIDTGKRHLRLDVTQQDCSIAESDSADSDSDTNSSIDQSSTTSDHVDDVDPYHQEHVVELLNTISKLERKLLTLAETKSELEEELADVKEAMRGKFESLQEIVDKAKKNCNCKHNQKKSRGSHQPVPEKTTLKPQTSPLPSTSATYANVTARKPSKIPPKSQPPRKLKI